MRKFSILLSLLCLILLAVISFASANGSTKLDPQAAATVSINFDGLEVLAFGNPDRVSVGILSAPMHTPQMTITRLKDGKRTTVATLNSEDLKGTLYIGTESGNNSVSRYYGESINDPNDLRNTIDLEGDLFNRELHLNESKFWGKVHISTGLFYADKLTEERVRFLSTDSSKALPFNRRIAEPAAKIDLNRGDALVIKGEKTSIRLVQESGTNYEISLTNLPKPEMASMDHFDFYYGAINEQLPRYNPVYIKKAAWLPRPLICCAVCFSKARIN